MAADKKNVLEKPAGGPGLERHAAKSVHLIVGEDEYQVSQTARKAADRLCPPVDQAFGLEIIEADVKTIDEAVSVLRRCLEALRTVGFLSGRKVVWLKNATCFAAQTDIGDSAAVKEAVGELTQLITAGLSPGQILLVSAAKVFKASAFFKACRAVGEVLEFDLPDKLNKLEQLALARAVEAFQKAGLRVDQAVLEEFLDRVGTDTRQMLQEVEKLHVYLGERREVESEDVRTVVSVSRAAIAWDLADALSPRNLTAALKLLKQLLFQGENPVGLMFGLENRVRELLFYRELLDRGWISIVGQEPWPKVEWKESPEMEKAALVLPRDPRKGSPYRAGKLAAQARRFPLKELLRMRSLLIQTHESLFSAAMPEALQLEFLLIRMLGPAPKPAAEV